jgi:carbonic anhydrase
MKKLLRGIVDFRERVRPSYRDVFSRLALGQSPDSLFIACSDSRVVPNLFASTDPGDLFVVRNPANLIAPADEDGKSVSDESEAAAIEFAVMSLKVKDIIVCGHSECGGIRALCQGRHAVQVPHLRSWLRHAEPALERHRRGERLATAPGQWINEVSQLNVLEQLRNLESYPVVREAVAQGELRLHGWWFDIEAAEVLAYDPQAKAFVVIDDSYVGKLQDRL